MVSIGYLVPNVGLFEPADLDRRTAVANELAPPGTTVEFVTCDWGPRVIESMVEEEWAVVDLLRTARDVEDQFDAFIVGCFGDPGLAALREFTRTPVVGPAESSFHTACQIGETVACLNLYDATEPMMRQTVRKHGLEDRVMFRTIGVGVAEIDHDSAALVERMIEHGRAAVENGATVLVPGCMGLAFVRAHERIADAVGVPFVDPVSIAIETASTWARHGITHSREAYPPVDRGRLDSLFEARIE